MPAVHTRRSIPDAAAATDVLPDANYTYAVEVSDMGSHGCAPEDWARATFEWQPSAVRLFLVVGWRFGLWLRLGPRPSPDHVLGWKIVERSASRTILELRSPILSARLLFWLDASRLISCTFVRYENRIAVLLWRPASLIHAMVLPVLLRRAASHCSGGEDGSHSASRRP